MVGIPCPPRNRVHPEMISAGEGSLVLVAIPCSLSHGLPADLAKGIADGAHCTVCTFPTPLGRLLLSPVRAPLLAAFCAVLFILPVTSVRASTRHDVRAHVAFFVGKP